MAIENGLTYSGWLVFDKKNILFNFIYIPLLKFYPLLLWPNQIPVDHNLNKLKSTLSDNAFTQIIRQVPLFWWYCRTKMTTIHIKCYAKLSYVMRVINYNKRLFVMNYNYIFHFGLFCGYLDPYQTISTKYKRSDIKLACKVLITFCVINSKNKYYFGFGVEKNITLP